MYCNCPISKSQFKNSCEDGWRESESGDVGVDGEESLRGGGDECHHRDPLRPRRAGDLRQPR